MNKKVPLTIIKNFIMNQQTHQIMKLSRVKKQFKPVNVYSINNLWQIDLINFSKFQNGIQGSYI